MHLKGQKNDNRNKLDTIKTMSFTTILFNHFLLHARIEIFASLHELQMEQKKWLK